MTEPFSVTDVIREWDVQAVVIRCNECDEAMTVYDTFDPYDGRVEDAYTAHECPPRCLLCGEFLNDADRRTGARIDLNCWREQPAEAALALGEFIEARNAERKAS